MLTSHGCMTIKHLQRMLQLSTCSLLRRKSVNPTETALHLGRLLAVQEFQLKAPVPLTIASLSLRTEQEEREA